MCGSNSFHTLVVDGHDVEALARAFYEAQATKGKPTAIIAKTFKGKGIPGQYFSLFMYNHQHWWTAWKALSLGFASVTILYFFTSCLFRACVICKTDLNSYFWRCLGSAVNFVPVWQKLRCAPGVIPQSKSVTTLTTINSWLGTTALISLSHLKVQRLFKECCQCLFQIIHTV